MIRILAFLVFMASASCAGPKPIKEFALSKIALEHAKKAGAESYASGWYYKADTTFSNAEKAYKLNDNLVAKELFIKARKYAERAENSSRVQKFKSGDGPGD